MSKKHSTTIFNSHRVFLSALTALSLSAFGPQAVAADASHTSPIKELLVLNPGVSEAQMREAIQAESHRTSISSHQLIQHALAESREQTLTMLTDNSVSDRSSGGPIKLGRAYTGYVFFSPSRTSGVPHGHTGIYTARTWIVEAPGGSTRSRSVWADDAHVERGTLVQSVNASWETRTGAAITANSLLGRPYNYNFAFNKNANGSRMNCSQLVWAAYKRNGIDLDSNGGPGVYPTNIRDSVHTVTRWVRS